MVGQSSVHPVCKRLSWGVTVGRGLMLGGLFPLSDLVSHPWGPGRREPCSATVCAQTSAPVFIFKALSDAGPFVGQTPSLPSGVADSGQWTGAAQRLGLQTMEALMPSLGLQEVSLPNSCSYPTSQ